MYSAVVSCYESWDGHSYVLMLNSDLIPAVAQERVWSLVSPSPVFLVPKHSFGMLLDERHVEPERRVAVCSDI